MDKICLRLPNTAVNDTYTVENVLPTLNFPITHGLFGYTDMLKDFADFYMKYKDATALWHMGHICESHLFREMHKYGYIGDFDAPYTPIEVSAYLAQINEPPHSVDTYADKYSIKVNDYGCPHNPLYDCEVAYKVYDDIIKILNNGGI